MVRSHKWLALIAISATLFLASATQAQNPGSIGWKPSASSAQLLDQRVKAEKYPDLIVKSFRASSNIRTDADGNFIFGIFYELKNQGVSLARETYSTVHFSTKGSSSQLVKRVSNRGILPGKEARIATNITLPRSLMGQTVYLWLVADSRAANPSTPSYGWILESNENNNRSRRVAVRLPLLIGGGNQVLKVQRGR